MPNPKVLITGASGLIGGLVLNNLSEKYDFSALNRRKVERVPHRQADIASLDEILPAFNGIDTVLHLSAYLEDVNDWDNTNKVNKRVRTMFLKLQGETMYPGSFLQALEVLCLGMNWITHTAISHAGSMKKYLTTGNL